MSLTAQQREVMQELADRQAQGRGAQTAEDFRGFEVSPPWPHGLKHEMTANSARQVLERLSKRTPPLVRGVGQKPRTYRTYLLTDAGREAIS